MNADTANVLIGAASGIASEYDTLVVLEVSTLPSFAETTTVALSLASWPGTNVSGAEALTTATTFRITPRYGDVTLDGSISATDASWLLQQAVGLRSDIPTALGDVTGNTSISSFDAALVLVRLANPAYVFPCMGGVLPKAAKQHQRMVSLASEPGGWVCSIDDPEGIAAATVTLALAGESPVSVTGPQMLAANQEGDVLTVALAPRD